MKRVLLVVGLLIALPYARAPLYDFPAPVAFAGPALLNPYGNLRGTWHRANLHAHGRAWGGVTSGRQSSEEVARRYRALGYSVPAVSNYHHIAALDGIDTLPVYEHGYNLRKRHQLAIGARRVVWFDFPLWQSLSHQQFIIDWVRETADLVALPHPTARNAYSAEALRRLTGYQLIEVVNGPHRSEAPWDDALSSGRVVWALANDDSHDLDDPRRTAMAWNMINAPSASTADIIDALRTGRSYAVMRTNESASAIDTELETVELNGDVLAVTCAGDPSTFIFVGQSGAVRKTVKNVMRAEYRFTADDTYVRTVIRSPRTAMYLNPIVRHRGNGPTAPSATVNLAGTWIMRAALAGALALVIVRRRRRTLASPSTPAVADTRRKTA